MKHLFLSPSLAVLVTAIFAQQSPATAPVVKAEELVKFSQTVHDFGKIKQGVPVNYDFNFKNISHKRVIIETATASCGCTTPKWPQQPIAKGKTNKINAGFNAAAPGPFDKTIYVKLSDAPQPLELKIKGEVLSAEEYAKYEKDKKSGK